MMGFVAGTLVHTDKGLVPIQEIKVGDRVLSRPERGGQGAPTECKLVTRVFHSGKNILYRILYIDTDNANNFMANHHLHKIPNLTVLFISEDHLLWVKGMNGWVFAYQLRNGESTLVSLNSKKTYEVISISPVYGEESNDGVESGICPETSARSDFDMLVMDSPCGLKVHNVYQVGTGLYDFEHSYKSMSAEEISTTNISEQTGDLFSANTYTLEVEDYHTYFVGHDGIWVHDNSPTN